VPAAGNLAAFALTSFVLIIVPGPSVLFTISRALTTGRTGALLTVVGNAAGQSLQIVAVAFGIGAFVEQSIVAYTTVKWIGALYLVFLGVQAFRHRHDLAGAMGDGLGPDRRSRRLLADGFLVGVTNPKSIVLFVAVLPQFVDSGAGNPTAQLLLLGAVFPAIALVSDALWALGAASARAWLARSPGRMAAIGGTGGLAMIGLGVGLALNGRKD
jgi:threonine/homoserine/homoserine lactone efflux protein